MIRSSIEMKFDLYYLGDKLEIFDFRDQAEEYIEMLCAADEGYRRADFKISPALRAV
jgi:hypothetical protein